MDSIYRVRKLERRDLECRVSWFNSPEIYLQMPISIPVSLAKTEHWYAKLCDDETRADFVIEINPDTKSRELVAMTGLVDMSPQHRRAEIYILVSPSKNRMGIGSITMHWLCNYAFHYCGMEKLFLYTLETNIGARNFYERLGFHQEGILLKHQINNGKRVDRYIQGLLREEWKKLQWSSTEPVSFFLAKEIISA